MYYPEDFPSQAQARVTAARVRAIRELADIHSKTRGWSDSTTAAIHYVMRVFGAFAHDLKAEGVRQPREAAHGHADREILSLHMAVAAIFPKRANRGFPKQNKNLKQRLIMLLCLIMSLTTEAQTQSGTIVYTQWSQDEIVIAADSRTVQGNSYSDTACKIAALGNEIVFGSSGHMVSFGPNGTLKWSGPTIANQEFLRLATKDASLKSLAEAWGRAVKVELEKDGPRAFTDLGKDRILGIGFFAGFEKNGTLSAAAEIIVAEPSPDGHYRIVLYPRVPASGYTLGYAEVISEMSAHQTPEALQWISQLRRAVETASNPLVEGTVEIVQLTIDHLPKTRIDVNAVPFSEVGPPIAALRLHRGHEVEWIKRGKCP